MYCINCGNKLKKDDKFCDKCGEAVKNNVNVVNNVNNNQSDNMTLIFAVLSLVLFWMPFVSIPFGIVAIIRAKKENNRGNSILGIVGVVLSVLCAVSVIFVTLIAFLVADTEKEETVDKLKNYVDKYDDKIDDKGIFDYGDNDIIGYSWKATDQSVLYLNQDKSYSWYANDSIHDNNYYSGNYNVYSGLDAVNYIANTLSEYGITYNDQMKLFDGNNYELDDYYLIIFSCDKAIFNGINDTKNIGINPYYGFYDDSKLSLYNMKTKSKVDFTLNSKINSGKSRNKGTL